MRANNGSALDTQRQINWIYHNHSIQKQLSQNSNQPLHMDLNVSIQNSHHVSDSSLPSWQSGLGEAKLLRVADFLHQAWTLLVDGGDVVIQFFF